LVRLHALKGGWIHSREVAAACAGVPESKRVGAAGGDFSKLEHFELMVAKPNTDDPTKRDSGLWQPTDLARQFVRGEATVPKYAEIYDGRFLGFDAIERISIHDALGKQFDYEELMSSVATHSPDLGGKEVPPRT
jgi:hypothetical protein